METETEIEIEKYLIIFKHKPKYKMSLATTLYDYMKTLSYETDEEYQEELNELLKIYECNHIAILDELYLKTSEEPLLLKLYTLAAEKQLLQSDPEMGLILLFSFDCLKYFHALLKLYFTVIAGCSDHESREACVWNETNEHYQKIESYFGKSDRNC